MIDLQAETRKPFSLSAPQRSGVFLIKLSQAARVPDPVSLIKKVGAKNYHLRQQPLPEWRQACEAYDVPQLS